MFCVNCGKQIEGEALLCPECAAQQTQPVAAETQPAVGQENLVLTSPEAPAPKKKLSKDAIIALCLAAVVIVGVLAAVFFGKDIVNLFTDPEDQMIKLEKEKVRTLSNMFKAQRGSAQENIPTAMEMHFLINEDILSAAAGSGAMDRSFLSDILMRIDADVSGDKGALAMALGLGDTSVLTMNMLIDQVSQEIWWQIPELSDAFVYLNPNAPQDDVPGAFMAFDPTAYLESLDPELLSVLISRYGNIVLEGIDDVDRSSKKVTVDDISQKLTLLTAKITQEDLYDIAIDVMKTAKTDKELEALLDGLSAYSNAPYEGTEYYADVAIDLYQEMLDGIDETMAEMEEAKKNADSANYVLFTDYLDDDNDIIGRKLSVSNSDIPELRYVTVRKGDDFAFEAVMAQVTATGSGTEEDGICDGKFQLAVDGTTLLKLEVTDFAETEDSIRGKLKLKPTAALYTMMDMDQETATLMQAMLALNMELKVDEDDLFLSYGIVLSGMELLSVTCEAAEPKALDLTVPADYINMQDEGSEEEWLSTVSTDTLISNLQKAGVPSELIQELIQLLNESLAA